MSWYGFIQKYFGIFLCLGLGIGLIFPSFFKPVSSYALPILGIVMLITFISIDIQHAISSLSKFHNIALVFLLTKAIIPLLLYHLSKPLGSEISIAIFMLGITPFASISPTLTGLLGGDTEFILLNQVLMTLLAPLYMPFLIMLVLGADVQLNPVQMIKTLVSLIFIPFVLSLLIRPIFKKAINRTKKYYGAINILLIMIFLCVLLSTAAEKILKNPLHNLPLLGWGYMLGFFLIISGWLLTFFLDRKKRIGLSVANSYMNIGLTAAVAAGFFGYEVLLFILVYEIPANTLPVLMREIITHRGNKTSE